MQFMDQANLAFNTSEIKTDESILAIAWNIATEPKLYRKLAQNPYSPQTLQIISERFPDASTVDIIRAVVLAEPDGKYDRNFRELSKEQQEVELQKQADIATRIHKRLVQYCKKHAKEFSRLPKALVFESLSFFVFEAVDVQEIEHRFSQNQRRDFRVAVVHFIEDATRLSKSVSGKKTSSERPYFIGILAALALILFSYLANGIYTKKVEQRQMEAKEQTLGVETQKERRELPRRLIIPTINVDAAIVYVGLTSKGAMEVPKKTVDVGWFNLGPRPGERGSSVIAGHFNGENGEVGVFINLNKLKEGDRVYIEDNNGTTTSFVVRTSRTYDPGYADDVFSGSDSAHLNLITCDGVWDGVKKTYSKRLVVFTDITQ